MRSWSTIARPFWSAAFALVIVLACRTAPTPPRERVELQLDPAHTFALDAGSELSLVGPEGAVDIACSGADAFFTASGLVIGRPVELRITSAQLFRGDFRGQPWLIPRGGPASPIQAPRGEPLDCAENLITATLVEMNPQGPWPKTIEVRLPEMRAGFTELVWPATLRLPLRVSLP